MFSFVAKKKSGNFLGNFFLRSWFTVQSEPLGCNLTQIDLRPSETKLGIEKPSICLRIILERVTTIKKNRVNLC